MLILCLACCVMLGTSGCSSQTEYLTAGEGGEAVVYLERGEAAPWAGWLLTDKQLADLFDQLLKPKVPEGLQAQGE